jgi:hypothetical protein
MKKLLTSFAVLTLTSGCVNASEIPSQPDLTKTCANLRNTMLLSKSDKVNKFGNSIWLLTLPNCKSFKAVTGRANTQKLNRNQSGNHSPLPPGSYRVGRTHDTKGLNSELGGTWFIDLEPDFKTDRSQLGIHWDPSYERSKVDDGTAGCVALTNSEDLDSIEAAIRYERIHTLIVVD